MAPSSSRGFAAQPTSSDKKPLDMSKMDALDKVRPCCAYSLGSNAAAVHGCSALNRVPLALRDRPLQEGPPIVEEDFKFVPEMYEQASGDSKAEYEAIAEGFNPYEEEWLYRADQGDSPANPIVVPVYGEDKARIIGVQVGSSSGRRRLAGPPGTGAPRGPAADVDAPGSHPCPPRRTRMTTAWCGGASCS